MPAVMGVVNVTPDSFSDGGLYIESEAAARHGAELIEAGAAIVDVGGESTRPGAAPVSVEVESGRVVPTIWRLRAARPDALISVDTAKLEVAIEAVDAGARYINDTTAFRNNPEMASFVADRGLTCCLMHMQGDPRTMQNNPRYENVVDDVKAFLEERMTFAMSEGVPEESIHLDPGIGFGKTLEHNLRLLNRLDEIVAFGRPVVIGTSRKSFIGEITGAEPADRLPGTIATNVIGFMHGASIFRVHDVAEVNAALAVTRAILDA